MGHPQEQGYVGLAVARRCAGSLRTTNEIHYRSRKWKLHIVKQLRLRDCECHYRSSFAVFGEFSAALKRLLACCASLASSNFRSENVSTMLRGALDHVAVVFTGRAQAADYGHETRSRRKDTAKNRTLKHQSVRTRRVFCRAMGGNRVCYHHANRDVNRATLRIDDECATRRHTRSANYNESCHLRRCDCLAFNVYMESLAGSTEIPEGDSRIPRCVFEVGARSGAGVPEEGTESRPLYGVCT